MIYTVFLIVCKYSKKEWFRVRILKKNVGFFKTFRFLDVYD